MSETNVKAKTIADIEAVLDFVVEVEKLKNVLRKTRPVGLTRYENSAEHSWHVCISALMLKDFASEAVEIDRVIRMLLIHDLGEIDAGDTIIYNSETPEGKDEEARGVKRLLDLLPAEQRDSYMSLWYEFEAGETADSKFARAVDRIPPLLHNLHGDGHGWKENNISKEMVMNVNQRIANGSEAVWEVIEAKLKAGAEAGLLK